MGKFGKTTKDEGEMGQGGNKDKKDQSGREDTTKRDTCGRRERGSWDTSSARVDDTGMRKSMERRSGMSRGAERARSGTSWAGREQVEMIPVTKR